ncbi:MAG TPA: hypothetical protein VE968_09050 [Sphingomicrobium sp.]|nr:hypothetical protein [Sphingomicrobium sp.]
MDMPMFATETDLLLLGQEMAMRPGKSYRTSTALFIAGNLPVAADIADRKGWKRCERRGVWENGSERIVFVFAGDANRFRGYARGTKLYIGPGALISHGAQFIDEIVAEREFKTEWVDGGQR